MITLGGDAELELVDSLDPFTEGIVFSVLLVVSCVVWCCSCCVLCVCVCDLFLFLQLEPFPFQMITLGGDAELELVDSLDPFTEGIVFSVRPPKKSWKNIANLSGGEKTLSSLALVFALHHYKPTPLYVMDEIDGNTHIYLCV